MTVVFDPLVAKNTIFLGDATLFLPRVKPNSIKVAVFDPPYGIDFSGGGYDDSGGYVFSHHEEWISGVANALQPGGHVYIFVPTEFVDVWIAAVRKYLTFKNLLAFPVYCNNRFNMGNNYAYNGQYVIFAHKGSGNLLNKINWIKTSECWLKDSRNTNPKEYTYIYPNYFGNMIYANVKNNAQRKSYHPNEKNPKLIRRFIEASSNPGDPVLDCFIGGGATAIAAIESGRIYLGFENNPDHWRTAVSRTQKCMRKHYSRAANSIDKYANFFRPLIK